MVAVECDIDWHSDSVSDAVHTCLCLHSKLSVMYVLIHLARWSSIIDCVRLVSADALNVLITTRVMLCGSYVLSVACGDCDQTPLRHGVRTSGWGK